LVEWLFTNLVFNTQIIRATNIVFSDQANPTAGQNDSIFDIESTNDATIFKTIVSVDASKSANIKQLVFNHVTGWVLTIDNYRLKVDATVLSTGDANCVSIDSTHLKCSFAGAYANGLTIAAGGQRTIELVADVGQSLQNGDYIITSLAEWAPQNYAQLTAAGADYAWASVVWSDNAAPNVTPTTVNWFTDAGIQNLPSNTWLFVKGTNSEPTCGNGATNYPSCDNNILVSLLITRSQNSPGDQTINSDSSGTVVMTLDLYASSGDVIITWINLRLSGLIDRWNIALGISSWFQILAMSGVDSDFITTISLVELITIVVNTTRSINVVVNTNNSINERFVVSVDSVHSIKSNWLVIWSYPIVSAEISTNQSVQSLPTWPQTCDYYMSEWWGFGPSESMLLRRYLKEVRFSDGSTRSIWTWFGIWSSYSPYGIALIPWWQTVGLEFTWWIDLYPNIPDAPLHTYIRSNIVFSGVVWVTKEPDYCFDTQTRNPIWNPGEECPAFNCFSTPCENPYVMMSWSVSEQFYEFSKSNCVDDSNLLIWGKAWFESQYDGLYNTGENTVDGGSVFLYECAEWSNPNYYSPGYYPSHRTQLDILLNELSIWWHRVTDNLLAQTTTDYYGWYQFSWLQSGTYYNVRFGSIPWFESANNQLSPDNRVCVQAWSSDLNFTLFSKAIVSGNTWFDTNKDAIQQTGETTVDGMNMYLLKCINNMPVETIASTQTDYYGGYSFTMPTSGLYVVTAGSIPNFSLPDSIQYESCRTVLTDSESWNQNFWLVPAQNQINGQTWFDTTENGLYDSWSENTVDGMNVLLYACNPYVWWSRLVAQTQTDYYGGYQFSWFGAGWYEVKFGGIPWFNLSSPWSACGFISHNGERQINTHLRKHCKTCPQNYLKIMNSY